MGTISKDESYETNSHMPQIVLHRRGWLAIIGFAVVLWAAALMLWAQKDIDRSILVWHNALRLNKTAVGIFRAASAYGMSFTIFVFLIYLGLSVKVKQLRGAPAVYLLILLSYGIGGITGDLMKEVFDRPRPFVDYPDEIKALSNPQSPSLPSGHATKSMALAIPFVIFVSNVPRWNVLFKAVALLAAVSVGYARIFMGVHYPSDVLAGMGVAIATLPLEVWAANKICRKLGREKLESRVKVWAAVLFALMLYLLKAS